MVLLAVVFWLAVVALPGFFGSLLIARNLPGIRAVAAYVLWLPAPFIVLAAILAADSDPTLTSSQASYNYQLTFVIISFIIVLPWAIANVAGGVVGRNRRGRSMAEAPAAVAPAAPLPEADDGLPDWRHADSPSLSLAEIGERMYAIADRAGIERSLLPHVGPIGEDWGAFIDRDKFDYIYMELERGGAMFDLRGVIADELLYWVFRDRAYALAATHMAHNPTTPDRYDGLLADKQQEVLAAIDPRWGAQFAHERALKAGR